jgi:hypothetical protein
MSRRADDLPPEAAQALPLAEAFWPNADPDLVNRYRDIKARLERERQWVRRRSGDPLLMQFRELEIRIEASFIAKLRDGELTAWGREGSPIGPWREIPSSAWSTLQLDDPNVGTVKGPGVILFDVRTGPAVMTAPAPPPQPERTPVPVPPLPKKRNPGRPSPKHLLEMKLRQRGKAGELESSMTREAQFLKKWLELNHPDAKQVTIKTIRNRLGELYRQVKSK